MRLKARDGFTEGMALNVKVVSEARVDKLARVAASEDAENSNFSFDDWVRHIPGGAELTVSIDQSGIAAAFDEAQ